MHATFRFFGFLALTSLCLQVSVGQTNAPPADPHELVTRNPKMLSKAADRAVAIDLLDRAQKRFNLEDAGVPYALNVSFATHGSAEVEGAGTMEEFSDGRGQVRWTARVGDVGVTRLKSSNRLYGTEASQPIPLRIQLVRTVLLRPIPRDISQFEIRSIDVPYENRSLTCLLLSRSLPPDPAPRSWVEREQCVDPTTGLLRIWSEAPGIYTVYDYDGGDFHGQMLPRQLSIYEEGRLTVQIHVDSLTDAPNLDPDFFKPSPEMIRAGETFSLTGASRMAALRVDPSGAPASRFYQPVIIHAILDAQDGSVHETEALQDSADELGRAALDLVRNTTFEPTGFQQEVFITIHFHLPAVRFGGPPIAVFRSARIRWIPVGWHPKAPPAKPHGMK